MDFIALVKSDGTILTSWDAELRRSLCMGSAGKSIMIQQYGSDIWQAWQRREEQHSYLTSLSPRWTFPMDLPMKWGRAHEDTSSLNVRVNINSEAKYGTYL